MEKLLDAVDFASEAHKKQVKKASDIPYISHPLSVGLLLLKYEAKDIEAIAGILHDVIEDTDKTYEDILEAFGKEVADIVLECSEDKNLSWEERKAQHIKHAEHASTSTKRVMAADKLSNLYSIKKDYAIYGENFWHRFQRGKEKQKWYYSEMAKALEKNTEDKIVKEMVNRMKQLIKEIFDVNL